MLTKETEWEQLVDESVSNAFHDSAVADASFIQRRSLLAALKARVEQTCSSSSSVLYTVLELIKANTFSKKNGDLNLRQAAYAILFALWVQKVYSHERENRPGPPPQHFFLLLGGPGTGKTLVTNHCSDLLETFLPDRNVRTAFMHSAARLVNGQTFNSSLSVPVEPINAKTKSLGKRRKELENKWRSKLLLSIDEISMISADLYARGSFRAKQIRKREDALWGGLSLQTSGDFQQMTPVRAASLAADLHPDADLSEEKRQQWFATNKEALEGRSAWLKMDKVILLDYSHRCGGPLNDFLQEMMQGGISDASWRAINTRCLRSNTAVEARRQAQAPPFTTEACTVGVMRHSIRALKTYDRAKFFSVQAGRRLLISHASDRCVGQCACFELTSHVYKQMAAVNNLSATKHLAAALFLWRGMEVLLEEKMCVELGVVRGARAIIDDIVFDVNEPPVDEDASLPPHVLRFVPQCLILRLPGTTWVKERALGPGRFTLSRTKRPWRYNLKPGDDTQALVDKTQRRYLSVARVQLPVSNCFALTMYGLQGATLAAILLDLAKPKGMGRDELWMSLFVLLSRVPSFDDLIIYRLPPKDAFDGGPPQFLQQEMQRLASLQQTTVADLDKELQDLQCEELRTLVLQPLLTALQADAALKKRRQQASPVHTPARRGAKTTRCATSPRSPAQARRPLGETAAASPQSPAPSWRPVGKTAAPAPSSRPVKTPDRASSAASPPSPASSCRPVKTPERAPPAASPPSAARTWRPVKTPERATNTVHSATLDYMNEMHLGAPASSSTSAPPRSPAASPKPKSKRGPVSPPAPSTASPARSPKASPAPKTKRAKPTTLMRR